MIALSGPVPARQFPPPIIVPRASARDNEGQLGGAEDGERGEDRCEGHRHGSRHAEESPVRGPFSGTDLLEPVPHLTYNHVTRVTTHWRMPVFPRASMATRSRAGRTPEVTSEVIFLRVTGTPYTLRSVPYR